jgi:two-component system KDP operon response regulator KdpE
LVKDFRSFTSVPIIVLTDPLPEESQIEFYQAGADVMVSRPFSMRILALQLRALIQRGNNMPLTGLPSLAQGDLTLDPATRSVATNTQPGVHLTQLEFRMLYTLMTHPGRILSAEELVEKIWGYPGESNRELVRGLVQRLRAKIEPDPHDPNYILTEAGTGYYFRSTSS